MKKRPSWTLGALARIRDAGEKQFVEFLDEVSKEPSFPSVGLLPPVKGFRKGTATGLAQQKKALANRFVSKGGVSATDRNKADAALYAFWKAWGRKYLGDAPLLSKAIDEIEEALDSDADDVNPASPQIDGLFLALKDGSSENRCSREQVARFFLFSPFDSSPKIEGAIAGAKSAKDVDRDIALYGLPERLHQDEEDLRGLKDQVSSLASQLDVVAADILELQALRADKGEKAVIDADDLVGLKAKVEKLAHDGEALHQVVKALGEAVPTPSENATVRQRLGDLEVMMQTFGGSLSDAQDGLAKAGNLAGEQSVRLDEVETLLLGTQQELSELRLQAPNASHATSISAAPVPFSGSSLFTERLSVVAAPNVASLTSRDAAQSLLQANLSLLGLKKTAAEVTAREIVAASTSGSVVHFKGSLATVVARVCAVTLAGLCAFRTSVPVGVIAVADIDAAFRTAIGIDPQVLPAIVLEGLNNAPIETISDLLRDYVDGTIRPKALFFTSLSSGPSTLPESIKLLELGPILDLDVLDWRLSMSKKPELAAGQVSEALLDVELAGGEGDGVDDFLAALRKRTRRNPRLESVATRHFVNLAPEVASGSTSLQSAAYCWLIPLWRMNEVDVEHIEQETNGGSCDGPKEDPRLRLLIEDLKAAQRAVAE
jgi:hypothetical protein